MIPSPFPVRGRRSRAFTLVELMVSITILSMMLLLVFQMLDQTQKTWSRAKGMVSTFKEAREGFDHINRTSAQATLKSFFDTVKKKGSTPTEFERQSDLHFVCGPVDEVLGSGSPHPRTGHCVFFNAPLGYNTLDDGARNEADGGHDGLLTLLNGWGYFVEYGTDKAERPPFLNAMPNAPKEKYRFRLMEFRQPAEALTIYRYRQNDPNKRSNKDFTAWILDNKFGINAASNYTPTKDAIRTTRVAANNIISLIISPRLSENEMQAMADRSKENGGAGLRFTKATDIAPNYLYDSREYKYAKSASSDRVAYSKNQIPPMLQITMIGIDEVDAERYAARDPNAAEDRPPDYAPDKNYFKKVGDYKTDLKKVTDALDAAQIRYRVFTTNVRMRNSNFNETRGAE